MRIVVVLSFFLMALVFAAPAANASEGAPSDFSASAQSDASAEPAVLHSDCVRRRVSRGARHDRIAPNRCSMSPAYRVAASTSIESGEGAAVDDRQIRCPSRIAYRGRRRVLLPRQTCRPLFLSA